MHLTKLDNMFATGVLEKDEDKKEADFFLRNHN
jgi:hypothetical protein